MNRFARPVFYRMTVDADRAVQDPRFIGSYTSRRREGMEDERCRRILRELDIDLGTFVAVPARPEKEADHIFILRHTLMNPFLMDGRTDAATSTCTEILQRSQRSAGGVTADAYHATQLSVLNQLVPILIVSLHRDLPHVPRCPKINRVLTSNAAKQEETGR